MTRTTRRIGRICAVLVMMLVAAACQITPVTDPGPIGLASGFDLADVGYEASEFYMNGPAASYGSAVALTADGKWDVQPDTKLEAYKTRLVVYRPSNPADFNGTVIVEWLNVTAGVDLPNDWTYAHNELVRDGFAWVGVSAQSRGVEYLKANSPARYGSLNHPGDSFSYDIFTMAGGHVRNTPSLLGGLVPEQVIATGESQSASRLVTYINAMHLRTHTYDGFMVHSRGSGGSSLRQDPLESVVAPSPTMIRDDLDVPVFVLQAEDDVIRSNLGVRQPDTALYRLWEMAGTAHADAYYLTLGPADVGDGTTEVAAFDLMRNPLEFGCTAPVNSGPHTWIMRAAVDALDTWVRTGVPPVTGPRLDVTSVSPVVLTRDAQGNALGGIRSPHVDAPVATIDGINDGSGFCRLFGSTTPLTPTELAALYPTNADFVSAWSAALDDAVANGYLLAEDAPALLAAAQASSVPN